MLDERQRPQTDDYGCLISAAASLIGLACLLGAALEIFIGWLG